MWKNASWKSIDVNHGLHGRACLRTFKFVILNDGHGMCLFNSERSMTIRPSPLGFGTVKILDMKHLWWGTFIMAPFCNRGCNRGITSAVAEL